MTSRVLASAFAALLALSVWAPTPAAAQRKPTIVIMPAGWFSADEESATNLTRALGQQYERQGYTVVSADQARSAFSSLGMSQRAHYPDREAVRYGKAANADLVAYP